MKAEGGRRKCRLDAGLSTHFGILGVGMAAKKGSVPRIVAFSFIFVGLKFYGRRSVEAWLDLGFWKAAMPLWRVTSNRWRQLDLLG